MQLYTKWQAKPLQRLASWSLACVSVLSQTTTFTWMRKVLAAPLSGAEKVTIEQVVCIAWLFFYRASSPPLNRNPKPHAAWCEKTNFKSLSLKLQGQLEDTYDLPRRLNIGLSV